jgi:hypothetical protein
LSDEKCIGDAPTRDQKLIEFGFSRRVIPVISTILVALLKVIAYDCDK